jgi:radical SAM family uncharacterized protein/radical SAM-linked protein
MMWDSLLDGIEKPGRYLGNEHNACCKDFGQARVRFALAFPDVYEVGLSHLGIKILYHRLNGLPGVVADRVYTPWPDFEARLRERKEPIRALETQRPLGDFDFVGFSLQYELSYTNILTMLDLAGIPLRAVDRDGRHPWIIAGGPCAFNPEPLAEVFDLVVLGEAEQVLEELVTLYGQWQEGGQPRQEFLQLARTLSGIYIPSFFDVSYRPEGPIRAIQPRYADYRLVEKRLLMDLDVSTPIPDRPLVPLLGIVHDRLSVEIARGCTRGCRFCQAGYIYRPVRERHPQAVLDQAQLALAASGFEEMSLLSLSSGDYCQIQHLLAAVMARFAHQKVAISFPSLRVGTLTQELMELVRTVRKTGFTLAPEAGSERLRRVINKGICREDLLVAAEQAFGLGWLVLKLYFMMGLPTETRADLQELVDLSLEVWRLAARQKRKASVNVAVSSFVPKPQTPFQWAGQISLDRIQDNVAYLDEKLRRRGLRFKWHNPHQSRLEAVFARGDRRLFAVLLRAWELGARFDGWTERFQWTLWQQAFDETGLNPEFYANRECALGDLLPWDHLSARVGKDHLVAEWQRALAEEYTGDCRWSACSHCGVCDHQHILPQLHRQSASPGGSGDDSTVLHLQNVMPEASSIPTASNTSATEAGSVSGAFGGVNRLQNGLPEDGLFPPASVSGDNAFVYRLQYARKGDIRFFGQLEVSRAFARAVRRAHLPVAFSEGFHPHPKMSFGEALPLGMESEVEDVWLVLTASMDSQEVLERLNRGFPPGLEVRRVCQVARRERPPASVVVTYCIELPSSLLVDCLMQNWQRMLDSRMVKKTKRHSQEVLLGQVLVEVRQIGVQSVELDLLEGSAVRLRPLTIVQHIVNDGEGSLATGRVCKTAVRPVEENNDVRRTDHQCQNV